MSRRSSRARVVKVRSQQQQQKDNELYARLFGQDLDDDEDFILRQQRQNLRRERTLRNLKKYSYARGYTYCFDLDGFARLHKHPSYAIDDENVFKNSYKQEGRMYLGSTLGQLINRTYFGLPYTQHEERGDEGKTKNVCHHFLFENEDRKYHLDRSIATFKALKRHLQREDVLGRLGKYGLLRKDPELDQIVRSKEERQVKLQALGKKIQALEQRRANSINGWYNQDQLFLQHSRNQLLHDEVDRLRKELHLPNIAQIYFRNQAHLQELIDSGSGNVTDASLFLRQALTYYNSQQIALSERMVASLAERYSPRIFSLIDGKPAITVPLQVFHFGSAQLRSALEGVLGGRVQRESEAGYYMAKLAWRRMFRRDLPAQRGERPRGEAVAAIGRQLVEQARAFFKDSNHISAPSPNIDQLVNEDQLGLSDGRRVTVFGDGVGAQVSGKQVMLLCLYDWLLKAYSLLLPFVELHPEMVQLVTSQLFEKYCHGFVEAAASPLLGTFRSNLELFTQVVMRAEPVLPELGSLYFQWDAERGVGLLWRCRPGEEEWETEREEQEGEDQADDDGQVVDSPTKKVKENE